ncbi:hypothetical protein B0J15DRAFT_494753 [Fusarium solani]|uniref:VWFA domain-containing protein n=1 Tax=Fusarium solani TaxID=169388 RepID=A0A9P9HBX1_FUSSL|nr:uncharacterized protein B0J15DRAFT_494753 [Fusarium solani]KAH7254686.1 hypothetical protein B0J15DRAFT_494753 [Fusarium solani]
MATELLDIEKSICDIAVECEELFEVQIARFNNAGDQNGAALIAELGHQFSAWANSMRVFEKASLNLDRKLQGHPEIQDQVLRGLDLMQANLAYVHMQDVSSEEGRVEDSSPSHSLRLSIENVKAVSEALKRLHQIGMAIRHSSTTSHTRRAREYTESLDLSSFTQLASLALKSLFATASPELLEHLTASMTDTYRQFIYRRKDIEPPKIKQDSRLSIIPEDSTSDDASGETTYTPGPSQSVLLDVTRPQPAVSQSRPTTIDTKEAASRLGKLKRPSASTRRSTSSVLVSQVDYPKPAEDSATCDWCFCPLPEDTFEGDNWQQHINEDHRPFICISDECIKSSFLPKFSTSSKWFQHMSETHGPDWHRQVYAPSQWICPLCHGNTINYPSPEDLEIHLDKEHESVGLTAAQKKMVIKQSRASCPRPRGECPLCCFPIKDGQTYGQNSTNRNENNKRSRSPQDAEADGENKRFKKQTGPQTSALPESKNDPDGSSSRSNSDPEVIAGHVAGHLRTIMLLTLKIISIEGPAEVSSDRQSISAQTDYHLSRVASSDKDLEEITGISVETSDHGGEVDKYHDLQDTQAVIPDLDEAITWDHVGIEEDDPIHDPTSFIPIPQVDAKKTADRSISDVPPVDIIYEKLMRKKSKGLGGRARDIFQGTHLESLGLPGLAYARARIKARGGRHQIIVIDNSKSMESHVEHVAKTARVISYFTKVADTDAMDLFFTSDSTIPRKVSTSTAVEVAIRRMKFYYGKCDMADCLDNIMTALLRDGKGYIKPTSIYVYTDANWKEDNDVESVIRDSIRRLAFANQRPSTLMFQFIQFGDDSNGKSRLQHLDDTCKEHHRLVEYDIVDTKRWDDEVESIVIGSISRESEVPAINKHGVF